MKILGARKASSRGGCKRSSRRIDRLKFEHSEILNAGGVFWALKAWDMKRLGPGGSCLEPVLRSFRAPESGVSAYFFFLRGEDEAIFNENREKIKT